MNRRRPKKQPKLFNDVPQERVLKRGLRRDPRRSIYVLIVFLRKLGLRVYRDMNGSGHRVDGAYYGDEDLRRYALKLKTERDAKFEAAQRESY